MAKCSNKHPSWFKLKTERRQLIKELPPESAVNVLLACLDFLEVGSFPKAMCPIEKIAASAFLPDLEEAWENYKKRVENGNGGGRPKGNKEKPYGFIRPHMQPNGTEEDSPKGEDSSNLYGGAALRSGPPTPKYIPEFPVEDAE
mgnify:FL=1